MQNLGAGFVLYESNCAGRWKMLTAFVFLAVWPIPSFGEEMPDVKTVLEAWQKRQDSVRSARFTWTEMRTLKAGAVVNRQMAEMMRRRAGGRESQGGIIPDKDVTFSVTHKLTFDGDKARYERQGKIWDAEKIDPVDEDAISVFDGETPKTFVKSMALGPPSGWIRKSARNMDLWHVHNTPLLLLYRPFHPELRDINRNKLTVSNRQALIAGKQCFALQQAINPQKGAMLIIWVALQPDFPIMRRQETADGSIYTQFDFSYSANKEQREVLTGWKYVRSSPPDTMIQSSTSEVREYELNKPIDPKEFQLDFPPGTFVSDQRQSRGTANEFYVVKEDKSKRSVSRSELVHSTYDQLLSGRVKQSTKSRMIKWWLFVGGSIGLSLIAISYVLRFLWKRWKGVSRQS